MNNQNEQNGQDIFPHNPKILTMYNLLSDERKGEMRKLISETINKFKDSGKLEYGRMYPFEVTKAFDQDEPKQWVYMKCIFKVDEIPFDEIISKFGRNEMTEKLDNAPITTVKMILEDIDVFKEDSMFDWVDHVDRINKQNISNKDSQLFYENNIFKNDDNKNKDKDQAKIESTEFNKDSHQAKKMKMMDDAINTNLKDKIKYGISLDFDNGINKNNNEGINNEAFFDFYYPEAEILDNEEYFDVFKNYARASLNACMDNLVNKGYVDSRDMLYNTLISVKTLQSRFSNCDFWKFNRKHLADMGFMNFNNEMLLIPFWAFPVILKNSTGKILATKTGEELIITSDIDINDLDLSNSYGCTIYGISVNDLKNG